MQIFTTIGVTEPPQMNIETLESVGLSSISGIIVATLILVEFIKRLVGNVKWIKRVPLFVYVIVVATVLTVASNKYLKNSENKPLLQGNLTQLVWESIVAAAGSSGFYTWLRKPTDSPYSSRKGRKKPDTVTDTVTVDVPKPAPPA